MRFARSLALAATATALVAAAQGSDTRHWQPIARDGLHDPQGGAAKVLQEPTEALSRLAPDTAGNLVRWVEALDKGQIAPRSSLNPGTEVRLREDDILLNLKGGTPIVRFPHRVHTLWLDCSNCHEKPFLSKAGANALDMRLILQGEQCGICHGAVAFPLTECNRCHSVPRTPAAGAAATATAASHAPQAP
jgi:c(7)-type cytochrome triheme protein